LSCKGSTAIATNTPIFGKLKPNPKPNTPAIPTIKRVPSRGWCSLHYLQWVFAPVVTTINTFPLHSEEWLILLPWFMFRAALKFQEFGVKSSQALTN
jgi:hypothetical protein